MATLAMQKKYAGYASQIMMQHREIGCYVRVTRKRKQGADQANEITRLDTNLPDTGSGIAKANLSFFLNLTHTGSTLGTMLGPWYAFPKEKTRLCYSRVKVLFTLANECEREVTGMLLA